MKNILVKVLLSGKTIDLHGYTLENANIEIEKFILVCLNVGYPK